VTINWDFWHKFVTVCLGLFALIATVVNVLVAHSSYELNQETQQAAIFSQFQQQYNSIAARFPDHLLDPHFRPARGTDDYRRIEDYWIFCYAEWYETQKGQPDLYRELWTNYYSGLIQNALETPSLRYVLISMFENYGVKRQDMREFYSALRDLAANEGEPLTPEPQRPGGAPKPAPPQTPASTGRPTP
jgi:hypothetical protein